MAASDNSAQAKRGRDDALDFLKGFLVLIMVVHHSLEYFMGRDYPAIKYFDFVTGAFVFVAGFVVSNIYGARLGLISRQTCWRLIQRACKIILLFLVINTAINVVVKSNYNGRPFGLAQFYSESYSVFWPGNKAVAAFEILLPIAYTLIVSALLLLWFRVKLLLVLPVSGLLVYCSLLEDPPFNLYYLCLGLSGFGVGLFCDRARAHTLIQNHYRVIFVVCTGVYVALITYLHKDNLPLYLFGIVSIVGAFYLYAVDFNYAWPTNRAVVLLGQYSLLGYLAHILFLQLLYRLVRQPWLSAGCAIIPLFLACAFLFALCRTTQSLRRRNGSADYFYKLIFA